MINENMCMIVVNLMQECNVKYGNMIIKRINDSNIIWNVN